jgi:S-DNA-T family DNA segregation ATPase FtsK/SpoIIIE
MLVVTASNPRLERIQGAWVTEKEIQDVVTWAKDQKDADYNPAVIEEQKKTTTLGGEDFGEDEDLILAAKDLVVRSQMGSTSMLQRKLRVGFARAGRLMDILEAQAIVGPSEGSKARQVLITVEEYESVNLVSINDTEDGESPVTNDKEVIEAESEAVQNNNNDEDDSWFE